MLVAERRRRRERASLSDDGNAASADDLADLRDPAPERGAHRAEDGKAARTDGEQKLIVLTAAEREVTRLLRREAAERLREWHAIGVDARRDAGGGTEPVSIDQQPVAQIDHRCRDPAPGERRAGAETRPRALPARQ